MSRKHFRDLRIAARHPMDQTAFQQLLLRPIAQDFVDQLCAIDPAGIADGIQNINGQAGALTPQLNSRRSRIA